MLVEIWTLGFLGLNAWNDIRKREILLWSVVVYIIGGAGIQRIGIGLVTGVFFGGISLAVKDSVGAGDVWILSVLAAVLGMEKFLIITVLAFFAASFYAGFLLITKKAGRKTEIPFVPFIFLGYVGGLCIWHLL